MNPAIRYEDVRRSIAFRNYRDSWWDDSQPAPNDRLTMVGLLFARPDNRLSRDEILSSLQYFHERSGDHVHFFCAGFTNYEVSEGDYRDIGLPGWRYSDKLFNEFRGEIESLCRWRYSGGVDLLLSNAYYNHVERRGNLDFRSTIICQLDSMLRDGAIDGIAPFFEQVFRFAEDFRGNDPTWGFSDQQGVGSTASALKRFVLALLPKDFGNDVQRISHFCVKDVSCE